MNDYSATVGAPSSEKAMLSLIITVYRGSSVLDDTIVQLLELEKQLPNATMEIIAIDDGSDDDSFDVILRNQQKYPNKIRAIRFSKNYGPMAVAQAGIEYARGDCVAVVSQDLQDPPESIVEMFAAWRAGDKVNMTYRIARDEPPFKKLLARSYHFIFRTLTGVNYPHGGLGIFLIDRQIADEIKHNPENHTDILLRIFSMGSRPRLHPAPRLPPKLKSNWTFTKNIKLVIDNFIGFSYLPVRLMSLMGIVVALASFAFAGYVFLGKLTGWYPINQPPGWATIVVLLTFLIGLVMLMLGIIGEYLWRILDKVRGRPMFRVEEVRDIESSSNTHKQDAKNVQDVN